MCKKISIITPSFNQGRFIEQSIKSVLQQNYPKFEHIIIDGGSTDETIEIVKKYPHLIWLSEKDEGISDALNKGIKIATGEIIGWLNCDDYYLPETFQRVAKVMTDNKVKWIIGNNQKLFDSMGKISKTNFVTINSKSLQRNCDMMRTNAAFYKKEVFDIVGNFNLQFKMVMDYDFFIRLAKRYEPVNINQYFHVFRVHTDQITTYQNLMRQYLELLSIFNREKYYYAMIVKTKTIIITSLKRIVKLTFIKFGIISKEYKNIPYSSRKSNEI